MDETKPAGVGPALSEGLGAGAEARCWWPSGHFWSQPDRWGLVECFWCAKRVSEAQGEKQ